MMVKRENSWMNSIIVITQVFCVVLNEPGLMLA